MTINVLHCINWKNWTENNQNLLNWSKQGNVLKWKKTVNLEIMETCRKYTEKKKRQIGRSPRKGECPRGRLSVCQRRWKRGKGGGGSASLLMGTITWRNSRLCTPASKQARRQPPPTTQPPVIPSQAFFFYTCTSPFNLCMGSSHRNNAPRSSSSFLPSFFLSVWLEQLHPYPTLPPIHRS